MGAAERAKGIRAEVAVVHALREAGWLAVTTRAENGTQGGADIHTDAPLAIEVKDHAKLDLAGWVRQAEGNAPEGKVPVVWHKRRGRSHPSDWYVTMTGSALLALTARVTETKGNEDERDDAVRPGDGEGRDE